MGRDWKVWKKVACISGLWFPVSPRKLYVVLSARSVLSCQTCWALVSLSRPFLSTHGISPRDPRTHSTLSLTTDNAGRTLLPWDLIWTHGNTWVQAEVCIMVAFCWPKTKILKEERFLCSQWCLGASEPPTHPPAGEGSRLVLLSNTQRGQTERASAGQLAPGQLALGQLALGRLSVRDNTFAISPELCAAQHSTVPGPGASKVPWIYPYEP